MRPRSALAAAALATTALASCGGPLPDPSPRIVATAPSGVVPRDRARAEFTASVPLSPEGILDGRRIALCRADDVADVKRLAGQPAGLGPGAPVLAATATLEDAGRRAVIAPSAPLVPSARYAAVLAVGVHAADGRPVLDADGRQRPVVVEFEIAAATTGASPAGGPPVRAAITEVLTDAATPEAAGEYVEVMNLGAAPLDLAGYRIAKPGTGGGVTRCVIAPRTTGSVVPPRGLALVAGGAYDGRYLLPAGTIVYQCGSGALVGGLANDRPAALQIEDPAGGVLSSIGVTEPAPRCTRGALHRIDPAGPDAASNLDCPGTASPGTFP